MKALADTSAPGDDQAYRKAFDKLVAVVRMLHDRESSSFSVPTPADPSPIIENWSCTKLAGMTPAEILNAPRLIRLAM